MVVVVVVVGIVVVLNVVDCGGVVVMAPENCKIFQLSTYQHGNINQSFSLFCRTLMSFSHSKDKNWSDKVQMIVGINNINPALRKQITEETLQMNLQLEIRTTRDMVERDNKSNEIKSRLSRYVNEDTDDSED